MCLYKYLECIIGDSVITCNEIIKVTKTVLTKAVLTKNVLSETIPTKTISAKTIPSNREYKEYIL